MWTCTTNVPAFKGVTEIKVNSQYKRRNQATQILLSSQNVATKLAHDIGCPWAGSQTCDNNTLLLMMAQPKKIEPLAVP